MAEDTTIEDKKLFVSADIEQTDSGLKAIASTAIEDRDGETIQQEGWDLKNFKKNPVLLWSHDHTDLPIGTAKGIKVEGEGKSAKLTFEPVLHEITDKAKAIKQLVEAGIIKTFSVGFRPMEMDGDTYSSQELLEISLVNVPANPQAVMALKGFDQEVVEDVLGEKIQTTDDKKEENPEDKVAELQEQIDEQAKKIEDLVKGLKHLNPNGRKSEVVTQRLALSKIIARSADKVLEGKPTGQQAKLLKVIKRSSERLIVDQKQELNHGKIHPKQT